jgi:hypothetical protein
MRISVRSISPSANFFSDEQRRLGQQLLAKALERFEQSCDEVYQANHRLIDVIRTRNLPLPDALRMAAQSSLNRAVARLARQLSAGSVTPAEVVGRLRAYQQAAKRLPCCLDFDPINRVFETIIERHIALLAEEPGHAQIPRQALEVAQELTLGLNLWRGQNLFWRYLAGETHTVDLPVILELGTRLGFNQAVVSKLVYTPPAAPNSVTRR